MSNVEELESAALTGRVVGHYEILNMIGKGGMGVVFRAKHLNLKRIVAFKILPPSTRKGKKGIPRFLREVELLAKLSHPNIAMAYDAGVCEGLHYLAMEFVNGTSLKSLVLQRGPLPVAEALGYVRQVAQGMAYAHRQNIIHRDIKPSNLMVTEDGVVKILDLGVARMAHSMNVSSDTSTVKDLTSQVTFVGTAEYTSPEQARNSKSVSGRSDLYSLGCTLHFLLTGKAVFQGESTMEFLMNHQTMPRPSLVYHNFSIPHSVDRMFQKMIAIAPEQRYSSMEDLLEALDAISLDVNQRSFRKPLAIGTAGLLAAGLLTFAAFRNPAADLAPEQVADPPPSRANGTDESHRQTSYGLDLLQEWTVDPDQLLWVNLVLATHDGTRVVIAGGRFDDRPEARFPVIIRNIDDGTIEREFGIPESWTWCGAASPDGQRLLVGTGGSHEVVEQKPIGGSDFAVYVWNLSDPGQAPLRIGGHWKAVSGAAFLTGDRIVAGSFDASLRMFDAINAAELRAFENPFGEVLSLAASPRGDLFATGHFDKVAIWEPDQSAPLASFDFHLGKALAFSPDGGQLAAGGMSDTIDLWDLEQQRVSRQITHDSERVNCLAWGRSGDIILSGHNDGAVNLWEIGTNRHWRRETIEESPIKSLSICPDQARVITGSSNGMVRLWSLLSESKSD